MSSFQVGDRVVIDPHSSVELRGRVVGVSAGSTGTRYTVRIRTGGTLKVREHRMGMDERRAPDPGTLTRTPDYSLGERKAQPKDVPTRDRDYLAYLRTLSCAFCGASGPSEVSHHGHHGIGTKASDHEALPACRTCHQRWHDKGSPIAAWDRLLPSHRRELLSLMGRQHREEFEVMS